MASVAIKYVEKKGELWPKDREPFHGDIVQGRLGNCFFIAAVQAIVSSQPNVLKSIVISELNDNRYRCIFYRQGEQIEIDVDLTNIPVDTNSNIPLYCRSTSENIVWPYVFEKAYSQFYGSYDNLIGGNTSEAFYDLLGLPVDEYEPIDEIWNVISNCLRNKEGFVTCGAIDNTVQVPTIRNGIRINHAYVILTTYVFQTQRYLLIHNPQGINDIQQENRLVRKAFFTSSSSYLLWENQQGTQFLAWKDLSKMCNRIQICYCTAKSIYNKPLFSQWTQSSSGGCSNLYSFYLNPFILIPHELKGKMLTILIGQNDQRCERTNPLQKLNYPQLGITVVKFQKQEHEDERAFIPTQDRYELIKQSKYWNKRDHALRFEMPTHYDVNIAAIGVILSTYSPNMLIQFWLQFYIDTTIPMLNTFNVRTLLTLYPEQQHFSSKWTKVNSGGRYQKNTFYHNVGYRVLIEQESVSTSVTIILHQIPYTNSKDTPIIPLQNHHPIGLYVFSVTDKNVKLKESPPLYSDAEFIRARSISKIVQIHKGHEYYVVPTCFESNSEAAYDLTFLSDILLSITKLESIDILKPRVVTPPKNKTQQKTPSSSSPIALSTATRNVKRLVHEDFQNLI